VLAVDLTHLVVASDGGAGSPPAAGGDLPRLAPCLAASHRVRRVWPGARGGVARDDRQPRAQGAARRDRSRLRQGNERSARARVHVVTDQLAGGGARLLPRSGDRERAWPTACRESSRNRVEQVAFVRAVRERACACSACAGLDQLNFSLALLGMKARAAARYPVVLLDQLEDHVRTQVLPVLAGRPYQVGRIPAGTAPRTAGAVAALRRGRDPPRAGGRARARDVASIERANRPPAIS